MAIAARLLRPSIDRADAVAKDATDRLVAAHRDGWLIPPSEEPYAGLSTPAPLPLVVEEYVSQFDAAGRAAYEARARSQLENGATPQSTILALDALRFQRGEELT